MLMMALVIPEEQYHQQPRIEGDRGGNEINMSDQPVRFGFHSLSDPCWAGGGRGASRRPVDSQ
ncbi:hypothetical protein [Klebsiella pneumoniae]|nr:hypothetical protein [Klebsiella pneumoniae]